MEGSTGINGKVDAAEEENERSNGDVLTVEPWDDTVAVAGIRALRSNVSATGENTVETEEEDEEMREGETTKGGKFTVEFWWDKFGENGGERWKWMWQSETPNHTLSIKHPTKPI